MSASAIRDRDPAKPFTRRRLLEGAAGLAVLATQYGRHTPLTTAAAAAQGTPGAGSATSWLLVVPGSRDTGAIFGDEVVIYSGEGRELARLPVDTIQVEIVPTGDPRSALAVTDGGLRLVRLDPPKVESVPWKLPPTYSYYLDEPRGRFGVGHPRWAIVTGYTTESAREQVLLVDLDRHEAQEIGAYLGSDPPGYGQFSPSGAYLTFWETLRGHDDEQVEHLSLGHAWLVPTADPRNARELVPGEDDWLVLGATVSPDDRLVAFTTCAPDRRYGRFFIQDVAGGDATELASANGWSEAVWLPGASRRLVTLGTGRLMIHEISASGAPTSTSLARGLPITDQGYRLSPDGGHLLYGSRTSEDGPPSWQWVDLKAGTATTLADLAGLAPYRSSGINQWPRWVMFGPETTHGRYDPGIGLDMATGMTTPLIKLMQRPDKVATSVDGRIALLGTAWDTTVPARLVDLSTGKVTPLRFGRERVARSGVIRPDGGLLAVHTVANKDHALQIVLVDPTDPATAEPLSPGAAVLWTGIG